MTCRPSVLTTDRQFDRSVAIGMGADQIRSSWLGWGSGSSQINSPGISARDLMRDAHEAALDTLGVERDCGGHGGHLLAVSQDGN